MRNVFVITKLAGVTRSALLLTPGLKEVEAFSKGSRPGPERG